MKKENRMGSPVLSVCLITYNHAKYIKQALDGILMQKADFPWDLIIADDFSTDGTRDIILEYRNQYPDLIKLVFQEKNVGPAKNWRELLTAATGKYIAYCEGDDYWIDANKIQKQIDFLENHPEYVGCFHNTEERYEEEDKASLLYCNYPRAQNISFHELSYANVIPSCSMIYRNNLSKGFPSWLFELKMGDWPMHLINACDGDYWYMPKVMGVHRLHKQSTWMLQDLNRLYGFTLEAYDIMIEAFGRDTKHGQQLATGREAFLVSIKPVRPEPSFKRRVKSLMKRVIDKI